MYNLCKDILRAGDAVLGLVASQLIFAASPDDTTEILNTKRTKLVFSLADASSEK